MINHKVCFVGQFVLNENDFDYYSRAGNNYQKKVIEFIKPESRISIFPYFYKVLKKDSLNENFFYSEKALTSHGMYFLKALIWGFMRGFQNNSKNILYYNFTPYYLGFFLSSFLKRKRQYFIIADYWQKNSFMQNVQNFIVSSSSGVLALNENIKMHNNSKYLYGLIDKNEITLQTKKINNKLKFLFSGSIGYETGFDLCISFFKNNPEYELFVSGFLYGNIINDWKKYQNIIDTAININYLGELNKMDYLNLLNNSDVCFSLRNPDDEQHKYNFPSKILEYLSNGKFVISSINYRDLDSPLFYKTDFTTESLKLTIRKICDFENEINQERQVIYQDKLVEDFGMEKFNNLLNELMA